MSIIKKKFKKYKIQLVCETIAAYKLKEYSRYFNNVMPVRKLQRRIEHKKINRSKKLVKELSAFIIS